MPHKKDRRFIPSSKKSRKYSHEFHPLISDNGSGSDEEIVLHDGRFLVQNSSKENSLRKINTRSSCSNGNLKSEKKWSDLFDNCEFLHLDIKEGDTLQSVSIKYQCSISDIKRANHMISDQDFHGHTHLRIPVRKHGLLTEILPLEEEAEETDSTVVETLEDSIRTVNISIGGSCRCPSPRDPEIFFQKMDEDLVKIRLSTNSQKDSLEAARMALTSPQFRPLFKESVEGSVQWNYLICIVIVIAIVVPTLVAIYMYVWSSPYHNVPFQGGSSTQSSGAS